MKKIRLLLILNDKGSIEIIKELFLPECNKYNLITADTETEYKKIINSKEFEAVIADLLYASQFADDFNTLKDVPLIIITDKTETEEIIFNTQNPEVYFLYKDSANKFLKVLPVLADALTICRQIEDKNRLLSGIIKNMKYAVYVIDNQDNIVFVNKTFIKIFGYTQEEIINCKSSILWKDKLSLNIFDSDEKTYGKRKDGSSFIAFVSKIMVDSCEGKDNFTAVLIRSAEENALSFEDFVKLSNAVEQTADSVIITDKQGIIEYVNPGFEKLTGYSRQDVVGKKPDILKSGRHDIDFYKDLWNTIYSGNVFRNVFINKKKNGELFYQEQTITPIKDSNNKIVRYVSTGYDVTENKRMEESLQEANEKLILWIDELEQKGSEIFILSEMADKLQTCLCSKETQNDVYKEAYEVMTDSLQKLFPSDSGALCILNESKTEINVVSSWGNSFCKKSFGMDDCWALNRGKLHIIEDVKNGLICKHIDSVKIGNYLCAPMMYDEESLGILYLQWAQADMELPQEFRQFIIKSKQRLAITVAEHVALALANIKLRNSLREQAIRDPLTNLFNRRYLEETLDREIHRAKRENTEMGIIILDIDFFKKFNDTLGHEAGDTILFELGSYLIKNSRIGDIACRYGGEEFLLFLAGASIEETIKKAENIRQDISKMEIHKGDYTLNTITVSAGVASFPSHGSDVDELIRSADKALYQAKHEGRNKVVVFKRGDTA